MTPSLGSDFAELSRKFNLNLGASVEKGTLDVTVVFQLLMMKYGIRKTFCWIAWDFPDEDDWTKFEMPFGDQMIWLKKLKDVVESFGLIVYVEKLGHGGMEFNHKMIKNKVGIDDAMIQTLESQIGARDSCNYGDGKRSRKFWILKKELLPDIEARTGGNVSIGHILEYPDCCINYFVDQKTRILNDCVIDSFNNSFTRDEQVIVSNIQIKLDEIIFRFKDNSSFEKIRIELLKNYRDTKIILNNNLINRSIPFRNSIVPTNHHIPPPHLHLWSHFLPTIHLLQHLPNRINQ